MKNKKKYNTGELVPITKNDMECAIRTTFRHNTSNKMIKNPGNIGKQNDLVILTKAMKIKQSPCL